MTSTFRRVLLRIFVLLLVPTVSARAADSGAFDVVIYGATPGGIAAAVAAGKSELSVLLVEPTNRIGGLMTSGLSHSDFHSFESLTGAFLAFSQRVENHYRSTYGDDSPQVRDSFRGTHGEPQVNLLVFEALLREQTGVRLVIDQRLKSVALTNSSPQRRIAAIELADSAGGTMSVQGKVFIDASYEGDLMAAAGVPWRTGREGRQEYDESLAPNEPDGQLQAYNLRLIMTRDERNRVSPTAPPGYRREDFVLVLDALQSDRIRKVFDYPGHCIFKAHEPRLPNGKHDINDVSSGLVRLSLPGKNLGWPDGDAATRARIYAEHVRDQVGLLFFLQNDESVPEVFRREARQWGWCGDEFTETDHLPPQLYVREARRMVGMHVFTQSDSEHTGEDARAVLHANAIAMADYGNNCHGTAHQGPRFGGEHTGEFYNPVPPYQIPNGVIAPKDVANLLVPVAASSSHVGFCALRLEPVWMSLGQAAGHAAALSLSDAVAVQHVDVSKLQRRLHEDDSATIYVSDMPPDSPDFEAVQWWGTTGGLHGLTLSNGKRSPRGQRITSQYTQAAPHHAVAMEEPLTAELAKRWMVLADSLSLDTDQLPVAGEHVTRGEFIRAAKRAYDQR